MSVVLYDIDWTLLVGGTRMLREVYDHVFDAVFDVEKASIGEIDANGLLTTQVLVEVLKLHSVPEDRVRARMVEAVAAIEKYYSTHEDEDLCALMPGAYELLATLNERRTPQGLLTGNIESVAWKRIAKAGLRRFLDFGAFGDMAYRRADLVLIARQQANENCGIDAPLSSFVIVGDTPADVATARTAGALSIGVGAGAYAAQALAAAGADLVVDSLQDQENILHFLDTLEDGGRSMAQQHADGDP